MVCPSVHCDLGDTSNMPPDSKDMSSSKGKSSSFPRIHAQELGRKKGIYLSPEALSGFDNYKYKSEDTSPLSNYITHPFWNAAVEIFPRWLAPNVLTFSGWCLLLMIYLVTSYYDPHFTAAAVNSNRSKGVPQVWWFIFALAHFASHTFDGCDGKQARRTKSSSPLGELFDHGLDSSAAFLIPISLFSLFGHGSHSASLWELYRLFLACLTGFYVAHWEKYNTGVLFLPWTYDASQLAIVGVYLLTFYYGVGLWKTQLVEGFPLSFVFLWSVYGSSIVTLSMTLYNMYRARITKSDRGLSLQEGLVPLVSFILLVFLFSSWAILSPANIMELQPRFFFTAVGIVFSNITCRLIVCTMTSLRCQRMNAMLYPLCGCVFLVSFVRSAEIEVALLVLYTLAVAICHVHYGVSVVRELCDHLRIHCFSIKKY